MSEVAGAVETAPQSSQPQSDAAKVPNKVSNATQPFEQKAEVPKALSEKLKVDGSEIELSPQDLKSWAQKGLSATKRFEEAKKLRALAEQRLAELQKREEEIAPIYGSYGADAFKHLLERHRNDPEKMKSLRQAMEEHLVEQIKMEGQTPEAQEAFKFKQAYERERQEKEALLNAQKQAQFNQMVSAQRSSIEKSIIDTLKASGLPATEWNVKKVVDLMVKATKLGLPSTPERLASLAKEDTIEHIRALGGELIKPIPEAYKANNYDDVIRVGEQLTALYGKELLDALRYYDLAMNRKAKAPFPKPSVAVQNESKEIEKPMTWDEMQEFRKKRAEELQASMKRV